MYASQLYIHVHCCDYQLAGFNLRPDDQMIAQNLRQSAMVVA